jgi:hypothetical protein
MTKPKTKVEFVWPGDEYDSVICITADELRATGFQIPQHIPGCAWVPKYAVDLGELKVDRNADDPDVLDLSVQFNARQPFRWQRMEVEVEGDPDEILKVLKESTDVPK